MKLDDILNQSVDETSFSKMKSCSKAIQILQSKAVELGIFKRNEKKLFYHIEESEASVDKDLL